MITRANLIHGPARLVRGAGSVHTKESFPVNLQKSTFPIAVQGRGTVANRVSDLIVSASFVPDGRWTSAARAFLWPHLNPTFGADIFGTSDTPTVIHDVNSHLHTIIASAVTQMPSLRLSSRETMIGSATITGIRGTGLAWNSLDSWYTYAASGGTFTDSAFDPATIKTQPYTGAWSGVSGFTSIDTVDGWTVDFPMDLSFITTDEGGTTKASLNSVGCLARCTPASLSPADILAAYDDANMGASVHQGDLAITGADGTTIITLKNAGLVQAGFQFGTSVVRDGELGWLAVATFTSGAHGAIATFA